MKLWGEGEDGEECSVHGFILHSWQVGYLRDMKIPYSIPGTSRLLLSKQCWQRMDHSQRETPRKKKGELSESSSTV